MITIDEHQFMKASAITLGIIGVIASAVISYRLYSDTQHKLKLKQSSNQSVVSVTDDGSVIVKVKRHMILPENEMPKVVPVKNVESLRQSDPFFANAHDGDDILIYSNKVILYSSTLDRIIEVAAVKPESAQ